jgi:dethiobiotin synthetase
MTPEGLRNEDALGLIAESNVALPYATVNPYCLAEPVSPHLAARAAGVSIELPPIEACFASLRERAEHVIVEGAGGWLAPLGERLFVADLAAALALPVVLVVGMRLGCLNHALLTAAAIHQRGLPLAGWVANHVDPDFARLPENVATLQLHLGMPPLASLGYGALAAGSSRLSPAALASLLQTCQRKQLT